MRCMILSRKSSLYATKRLAEESRKLGMKTNIIDTLKFSIVLGKEKMLLVKGAPVKFPDIVVPRIGASITAFGGCVLVQMEQMGIPLLNSSQGLFNSRDKFRSCQILSSNDLPIPRTLMLRKPTAKEISDIDAMQRRVIFKRKIEDAIEMIGGTPCIIKINKGTQGVGVVLCKDINDVFAQVDMLWKRKENFIIQEFVSESSGTDIRALVVGDKVVASMKRESKTGDFRSNTHQGGKATAYKLSKKDEEIAIKAASVLGLRVAGVDMLPSNDGLKIVEVNSSPGFEGLETATKKNVAGEIMKLCVNIVRDHREHKLIDIIPHLDRYRGKNAEEELGKLVHGGSTEIDRASVK